MVVVTYPGTISNQFKDGLKGEAHGKCKVHVGEKICEKQRSSVKLVARRTNNKTVQSCQYLQQVEFKKVMYRFYITTGWLRLIRLSSSEGVRGSKSLDSICTLAEGN